LSRTRRIETPIGAKITLTKTNGTKLNAMAKNRVKLPVAERIPPDVRLGKPASNSFVNLQVTWPNGARESIPHVAANQFITIMEGAGILSARRSLHRRKSCRTQQSINVERM